MTDSAAVVACYYDKLQWLYNLGWSAGGTRSLHYGLWWEDTRSLAELSKELAIPKSTLHGLLWTLTSRGWVDADPSSGRYRIGLQALLECTPVGQPGE